MNVRSGIYPKGRVHRIVYPDHGETSKTYCGMKIPSAQKVLTPVTCQNCGRHTREIR